jgi:DNA-binding NarL/FixJ family response regulator
LLASDTSTPGPIRVAIADDDEAFRKHFRDLAAQEPDVALLVELNVAAEVVPALLQQPFDVVLLSLAIGGNQGFAILEQLYNLKQTAKVIAVARSENQEEYVRAVRLGCRGIILKTAPPDLLVKSVRKVQEGELWLDRATTAMVLRQFAQELPAPRRERESKPTPLSPREREIVGLVTQGYKNKELAEKLNISEQTVKNHMHNIFDKLGVSDRLELALYAIHNHLNEG